eukprot:TRINITY_DN25018_c0_g1_i1.p1 TRINITY_DN25018_c0_g1~~TRINITY_DN25018_c0_g1_i1.p1  ORF type:complete len:380 (-),score=58.17 TRINITY_DN25018_c0_g1_i1:49-1188(-)
MEHEQGADDEDEHPEEAAEDADRGSCWAADDAEPSEDNPWAWLEGTSWQETMGVSKIYRLAAEEDKFVVIMMRAGKGSAGVRIQLHRLLDRPDPCLGWKTDRSPQFTLSLQDCNRAARTLVWRDPITGAVKNHWKQLGLPPGPVPTEEAQSSPPWRGELATSSSSSHEPRVIPPRVALPKPKLMVQLKQGVDQRARSRSRSASRSAVLKQSARASPADLRLPKEGRDIRLEIRTCGARDIAMCKQADADCDMRDFRDPGAGELRYHDGRHHEIIRRMMQHQKFTEWLEWMKAKVSFLVRGATCAGRSTIRIALFCKSGQHRAVAGATILDYVLYFEGFTNVQVDHKALAPCTCRACDSRTAKRAEVLAKVLERWQSLGK